MISITKTSDKKYHYANVLIFGESGSGKTYFLGTAKESEIIIIDVVSESGHLTLRKKNISMISVNSVMEMDKAIEWLAKEGVKKYKYVAIDSFSQFQKQLEKQLLLTGFKLWSEVKEITKSVVDRIKLLPINFIAICEVAMKEDEGRIKYIPSLLGASKDEIPYWFDEVYFFDRDGKVGEKPTYKALTSSGSKYPCKSRIGELPIVIENPKVEDFFKYLDSDKKKEERKQDDSEVALIMKLLVDTTTPAKSVLDFYKVKKLEDLGSIQRNELIRKLKEKIK